MNKTTTILTVALALVMLATTANAQDTRTVRLDPTLPAVSDLTERSVRLAELEKSRQKIEFLLSGYEYFPERDDLTRVTPDAHLVLVMIARDQNVKMSTRVRAVDALGYFEGHPEVARFMEQTLARGTTNDYLLRHTATSAMKAFRAEAVPWVTPLLSHSDIQMRLTAVSVLGKFGGDDGRVALSRVLERPNLEPIMRDQVRRYAR